MQPKAYSYIRFSTPEQEKGDTLRRQTQAAEKWAREHGFTLDDRLRDQGLSAFRGKHKTKGALGRFLGLVKAGKIPKGSVLIVEEMDRLSREEATEAIPQFFNILNAGVQVVTLHDGKIYSKESVNMSLGDRLQSFIDMDQAHQESRKKSDRLKAAWENKRNGINGKVLTGRCPAWLERSEDWKGFKKISDRCKVIQNIFRWKADGQSPYAIEKRLNETPGIWKPEGGGRQKGNKTGWRKSYIQKILRTPAVIGEYQPCRMIEGKRQPVGDPVQNYFPPVVGPDLFYSVQEKIKMNRETFKGGFTGKVSNLFAYLTKCGYCRGSMQYIDKGKPPKGGSYLVCDNSKRHNKGGCKSAPWRYSEFEEDLLRGLSSSIDVSTLLPDHDETEREIDSLKREKESIRGQLSKAESGILNLTDSIETTRDKRVRDVLNGKLSGILDRKEQLEQADKETEEKINVLERSSKNVRERIESMKELTAYLRRAKPGEVIDIRFKLREALRRAIDEIVLFSKGFRDRKQMNELTPKDRRKIFFEGIDNRDWKFYNVHLKGCRAFTRGFYPEGVIDKLKEIDGKKWKGFSLLPARK